MRNLQIADLVVQRLHIGSAILHELGIVGADFHVVMFEKPRGISAKFGFGTHVWTRAEGDPQPVVLAKFDESADVVISSEIELALGRFELVPEDVDADGVKAHRPRFFDAVFPELVGDAGGMHFAGDDFDRLAVDCELFVGGRKLVGFTVVWQRYVSPNRRGEYENCDGKNKAVFELHGLLW